MTTTISGSTGIVVPPSDLANIQSINGSSFTNRQRIMNGDMRRSSYYGTSAVTTTASMAVMLDRWKFQASRPSKLTFQQVLDAPTGFKYSIKITVASQYSPGASESFSLQQRIEGQVTVDLAYGTADAATVTTSAYIKGSVAGTYSVSLYNELVNKTYIGTVSVTTSWAKVQIAVSGDTASAMNTGTSTGLILTIDLGCGSNFNNTAGSWLAGGYARTADSVVFVNQVAGSTLNITGVKLEPGSIATAWEPYNGIFGGEEQACMRCFETSFPSGTPPAQNAGLSGSVMFYQQIAGANTNGLMIPFKVVKRTNTPTMTYCNPQAANAFARNIDASADFSSFATCQTGDAYQTASGIAPASGAVGNRCAVHFMASAEL